MIFNAYNFSGEALAIWVNECNIHVLHRNLSCWFCSAISRYKVFSLTNKRCLLSPLSHRKHKKNRKKETSSNARDPNLSWHGPKHWCWKTMKLHWFMQTEPRCWAVATAYAFSEYSLYCSPKLRAHKGTLQPGHEAKVKVLLMTRHWEATL